MTSSSQLSIRRFTATLAVIAAALTSQQANSATQCVNASAPAPLEICVADSGAPAVWVNQPNARQNQYFADYGWGSSIRLNGAAGVQYSTGYFGGTTVTPVSNTRTGSGTASDPFIISTVVMLGTSDVRLTQRFRYVNGDRYFTKIWSIENTGTATYNDLRFFHGGDTYFGGDDSARSWYDADLRMVYVNNSGFSNSGYMAFYANPLTPLSHYYSGDYSSGYLQVVAGELNDTFDSRFLDAGYYLQWNRAELRPGESWRIEAFETWSPPGSLQILTPGDEYVTPGTTVRKTFKIHNLSDTSPVSVTLAASTTSGWPLTMPGGTSATLAPLQVIEVPVEVQVPAGAAAGELAAIELNVTDGALNATAGTTRLRIPTTDYTFSSRLLDFGTASAGSQSSLVVTFTNGSSTVSVGEVGAANPLAAPFTIVADTCSNATLAAGATCTVTVRFSPTVGAEFSDSFGIPVAGEALVNETVAVTGTAIDQVLVTTMAGAGGSITPSDRAVTPGATAEFTVVANEGYRIAAVQGCGGALAGDLYTTAPVTTACAIEASFARIVIQPAAASVGGGGGVTLQTPSVQYGDTARFTITPAHGYEIGAISGCQGTLNGSTFTTQALTTGCTLSVTFVEAMSDVTIRGKGNGGGGATGLLGLGGLLLLALRRTRRTAVLMAGTAAVATAAQAGEPAAPGLHLGASFSAATGNRSGTGITSALQAQGYNVTASVDDHRMAWRLHGGWSFNQHLALEVGYSDLGKVSTEYSGNLPVLSVDGFLAAAAELHPRTANGFDLSLTARYALPAVPSLSLQARAGLFRWDAQRQAVASDGRSVMKYEDGANLLLGAGIGYAVTSRLELTAEWMRHAMGSERVQAWGMGTRYRW